MARYPKAGDALVRFTISNSPTNRGSPEIIHRFCKQVVKHFRAEGYARLAVFLVFVSLEHPRQGPAQSILVCGAGLLAPVVKPDLGLRVAAQIRARVDQRRVARDRNAAVL